MGIHEERLDDVVHYLVLQGAASPSQIGARIDAALADGVRWLIVDLLQARLTAQAEAPLAAAGHALRERRGELILVSESTAVADRVSRYDVADRPPLAATVDQALMILKLLRPTSEIRRPGAPARA